MTTAADHMQAGVRTREFGESLEATAFSERERELAAILKAYSEVTDRLKDSHERLNNEVVRLREELQKKNDELRRRDRLAALGEMAAGLAHEIRNPLGGIALYSSMLESDLRGQEKPLASAMKISNGVRSLDRLVSDILDFAQEDRLEARVIELDVVLRDVEDSLRPWEEQTGARLVIDDSSRNVMVTCDAGKMKQVLLNLLLNGLQAAGAGGHARLTAAPQAGGPRRANGVLIEVKDSGRGIPAEFMDRIFNPFVTTKSTGTGLGLAIVHRIIEAHGGAIRATNEDPGGAKFSVWLPDENGESVGSDSEGIAALDVWDRERGVIRTRRREPQRPG